MMVAVMLKGDLELLKVSEIKGIEKRACVHATFCLQCAGVVVRYRDRVHRPWSTVPPALASEVRALCCREGQRLIDEILTRGSLCHA